MYRRDGQPLQFKEEGAAIYANPLASIIIPPRTMGIDMSLLKRGFAGVGQYLSDDVDSSASAAPAPALVPAPTAQDLAERGEPIPSEPIVQTVAAPSASAPTVDSSSAPVLQMAPVVAAPSSQAWPASSAVAPVVDSSGPSASDDATQKTDFTVPIIVGVVSAIGGFFLFGKRRRKAS